MAVLMPPGIHHQKNKNHKTHHQQHDGARLVIPKLLQVSEDFVEKHANAIYTGMAQKQKRPTGSFNGNQIGRSFLTFSPLFDFRAHRLVLDLGVLPIELLCQPFGFLPSKKFRSFSGPAIHLGLPLDHIRVVHLKLL